MREYICKKCHMWSIARKSQVTLTCKAYEMDSPTRPPVIVSLDITANKAQNKTIKAPSTSSHTLSHLKDVLFPLHSLKKFFDLDDDH